MLHKKAILSLSRGPSIFLQAQNYLSSTLSQFNPLYALLSPCSIPTKPVLTLPITYTHAYSKRYFRFSFPAKSSKCF